MEGCGGGGSSSSTSCLMAFGDHDHSNALCPSSPMIMMMPPMTTSHPNADSGSNALFLPPPPPPSRSTHHHHYHHQNQDLILNNRSSISSSSAAAAAAAAASSMMLEDNHHNNINATATAADGCYFMDTSTDAGCSSSVKAKIMAHPHYLRLLAAYINCQKIGAPPEVVARLEEACASAETMFRNNTNSSICIGEDPALDQFMEAYCEMLTKYEQELSKPFKEAMLFLSRIECQFKALSLVSPDSGIAEAGDRNGSSEEDVDVNNSFIDPQAEDRELKGQLLRKYSGYLGSLKQEFMKKRKKGKLPKEARHQLLEWWNRHYKWPYPSESQKLALAESTGLDQKQINNWFINQRKRHWKPSEDIQFVVMDAAHPHYYMDNVLGNPFPMDISPALL